MRTVFGWMPGAARLSLALLCLALGFTSIAGAQPTRSAVSQARLTQGQTVQAAAESRIAVQFSLRDDVAAEHVRVHLATRLPDAAARALHGAEGVHWLTDDGALAHPGSGTPVWIRAEAPASRSNRDLWAAQVTAPAGQAAGDWLVLVSVTDANGNARLFDTGQTVAVAGQMSPPTLGANRSIEPTTVNVSSAAQTVTATVQILDGEGIGSAMLFLSHEESGQSAFGIATRTSGTATDGLWSAPIEIPQFAPTGAWTLSVFATDVNGAFAFLDAGRTLTVTGISDTQAPTLSGTPTVSPNVLDLAGGPATVTTTFRLLDDRSGVEYVSAYFENGDERIYAGSPQRTSGTDLNGVWEAVVNVPQNTPPGTYALTIYATDAAGNNREIATGTTLQIGGSDTAPPVLSGAATLSPTSVDLTGADAIVMVSAPLRDLHSGVEYVLFHLQRGEESLYSHSETLASGTALEGVWEAEIYVPQNTEEGTWTLFVTAHDSAGNDAEYSTGLTLQVGGGDVQAPTLAGVPVVTPPSVNLAQGPAEVAVRLRIQDNHSGVQNAYAYFELDSGERIYSHDAVQLSGDSLDGEWEIAFTIPQNTEPGTWSLIVSLEDEAGNHTDAETTATLVVSGGDVQGPRLAGTATLTPQAVDLTPGAQTVTVELPLADDTGVTSVYVRLLGALNARAAEGSATLVQGDSLSGLWRATLSVRQRTADGSYTLEFSAHDLAGNGSTLRPEGVTLTVTGGDVEAPVLAGAASVDPVTLDLTPGNGVVAATVPLSDPKSGLTTVTFELVDGDGIIVVGSARANRTSGTDQNGVWQAQIPIEQRVPPGTYTLRVHAYDRAGNDARIQTGTTVNLVINLPGVVSTPLPADGATGVPERPQLNWQPAEAATRYDLYLWPADAAQPAAPLGANLTSAGFSVPDTLVAGAAYRWRVVAKNGAGENVGPVWGFTVRRLPDLAVTRVQVPPTAQAGQFIEVRWTVTNEGGAGTNVPHWYDAAYLSADDKFDPPQQTGLGRTGDHLLTTRQNQAYLGPGESYVATAQVQLPHRLFGPLHIVVTTNLGRTSALYEADETNNFDDAAVQVSLPPPPDLQVTSLIAPPTVFAGQPFEVHWTITNRGTAPTQNNAWDEMIYLSRDSVLTGTRSILQEKRYRHVGHLKPDSAYTGKIEMTVPDTVSGPLFVHFVLDANDHEFEPGGEGNNSDRTELTSVLSPPPDLVVTRVQGPVDARSGEQVQVSWTVTNEGPGQTLTWWSDRIYIAATPVFDRSTAVPLAAFYNQQALAPDKQYGNTQSVRVPDGRSGPQYFFVEADWQGRIFEQQFEDNNVGVTERSSQVTLSPWADLEAVSLSAPAVATAGETVPFVWTVRNAGVAEARTSWADSVFISTSPEWNPASATFIGMAGRIESLASGAAYTQSLPLRLPVDRSGTFYAYVRVDANNAVYEHTDEDNNVARSAPISVAAYPPVDLAVSPISAPVQAAAGDRINVSWTVANNGTGATLARAWYDRLYLSTTDTLTSNRRELSSVQHGSTLRGGEAYTRALTVKLPDDLATGRYYLIADNTFPLVGGDIVPANNRRASAAIDVTATVPPDLQVTSVSVPPTLTAGQPVRIDWAVRNAGVGAVRDTLWYDTVHLARNAAQAGTQRLGTVARRGALAADGTYTQTLEATLPFFATGTYYLVVDADGGQNIYEGAREDNNRRLVPVEIHLPDPSDLVVRDVRVSGQAVVGEDVTVSWKLENQGPNVAAGRMTSGVYFSTDGTWDVEDALLALDEREIHLAPGAQAEFSSKVDLSSRLNLDSLGVVQRMPGVAPGAYHALVRADLRNNIRETDDANNTAASAGTSTVTVPALALGTPVTRNFEYRADHYFRVDVAAGLDLRLTLSRNAGALPGGVYVAYNRVPTPSDYDYANANIHEEIRQVVVPSTQAGTYYVLVRGEIIYFEHENFTLLGEAMGFSATNIAPRRGGQGTVTTKLTGAGFRPTSKVVLRSGNATVSTAETISVPSTTEMTVRWNLADVPVGSYRVFVVNTDGSEAELGEAFEVEPVVTPRLEFVRSAPNALLVARSTDYVFQFRNAGNVDIPYASILISVPAGTAITLETSGRLMSQQELLAHAGVEEERPVYMDGAADRFIPLLARDVAPGEALEAKVTVNPTIGGGTEFPIRVFAQLQDRASFMTSHLEKAEQFRRTVLANADAVDPTYVALAQNPADFAAFLLDGLVRLGVLHASDIPVALELLPTVQQNAQGAQVASLAPDFTRASPYSLVQPSMALTCEDVFFYTGCLAAALDCLPQLAVVPLSAGASAALCVFGLTTGCTPALDIAGQAAGADFSLAGCLGLASALNCLMKELICNDLLFSLDPNDIIGPDGYGDGRWVARAQTLPYMIRFENDPEKATAPAQEVRITLPIHPNLDVRSFRLGKFGFGSFTFDVPENVAFYTTRLDVRDSLGIYVDVSAGLDIESRQAFWTLRSIDPATGTLPNDPFAGFLAINDSLGRGEGFVTYTVRPSPTARTGDRVEAEASIVFDLNEPILTPPVFNTIDAAPPTSRIAALAEPPTDGRIALSWSAQDDMGGTGVKTYTLYVAEGDGPFRPHATGLTDTRYVYPGDPAGSYRFFVLAADYAGNTEAMKTEADVIVVKAEEPAELPTAFALEQNYPNPFATTTTLRFALPEAATVTLEVYNVIGQRVAVLMDGEMQPPGWHTKAFDGAALASGVYFYRLRAEGSGEARFTQTGKMVLVR